jgi:hypothetical protein
MESGTLVAAVSAITTTRHRRRRMATDRDRPNDSDANRTAPGTGRDMSGASYGATEREQTEDVRRRHPREDADVADGGVSEDLERDSDSPAD